MFRNFFIIVVLGFALFIVTDSNAQSCPPGYNSETIWSIMLPLENGNVCEAAVFYCWKDDANGNRLIFIDYIGFYDKNCLAGADLSKSSFWENLMKSLAMYQSNLDPSDPEYLDIDPCTNPSIAIYSYREPCWKFDYSIGGIHNGLEIGLVRCLGQTDLCVRKYTVCYDYSQTPPLLLMSTPIVKAPMSTICGDSFPFNPYNPNNTCWTIECVPGE